VLRIPPDPGPPPGDETKTKVFRAARNYFKYLLALWGLTNGFALLMTIFIFLLIWIAASHSRGDFTVMLPLLGLFGALIVFKVLAGVIELAVIRLNYEMRWYLVTDRSLRVREGVFVVREATITFANIQNISISQGPIQRLLGIADLRVDTAGGGSGGNPHGGQLPLRNLHVAWFRGVDNAVEIRELMQQRLRQLKDSGLGDHEEFVAPVSRAAAVSPRVIDALREVRAEAAALREAMRQTP
jgi:uncharacterized membrane protein YdbT with pleckstrin-like domain